MERDYSILFPVCVYVCEGDRERERERRTRVNIYKLNK